MDITTPKTLEMITLSGNSLKLLTPEVPRFTSLCSFLTVRQWICRGGCISNHWLIPEDGKNVWPHMHWAPTFQSVHFQSPLQMVFSLLLVIYQRKINEKRTKYPRKFSKQAFQENNKTLHFKMYPHLTYQSFTSDPSKLRKRTSTWP